MEYTDITFEPLSDIGANELELIDEHNELLNNKNYSEASTLMSSTKKGFKASLFNFIQERLRKLELFILNEFVAEPGEYYSYNEPNVEEMPKDAVFFIQIIDTRKPFEFLFGNVNKESLIVSDDGKSWFMSADTYGDNWRVLSDECSSGVLATETDKVSSARVFISSDYIFLRGMSLDRHYVFEFTASNDGEYDIVVNMLKHTSGGYCAFYVNDVYVGTIDTYGTEQELVTQNLLGVSLKFGEFANKLEIYPYEISGGIYCRPSILGFSFSAPTTIATITGITTYVNSSMMSIGSSQYVNIDTVLSNGGFYCIEMSDVTITYNSSDISVATIDSNGKIVAKSKGTTTITTTTSLGFTDTVEITVV